MSISPSEYINASHGNVPLTQFESRVLELANHVFSPMYRYVFQPKWHNGIFHDMNRNYCHTDWNECVYEVYIPTFRNIEGLNFYRIIIKVLPEIDWISANETVMRITPKRLNPPGKVDSELRVLISNKLKRKGFLKGKRLCPGYRTAVIIAKFPEQAIKRLLTIILYFIKKRLQALFKKLDKEHLFSEIFRGDHFVHHNTLLYIIDNIGLSLKNSILSLAHSWNWLARKFRDVLQEIGRQNMVKQTIKKVKELKEMLKAVGACPQYIKSGEEPIIIKRLEVVLFEGRRSCPSINVP